MKTKTIPALLLLAALSLPMMATQTVKKPMGKIVNHEASQTAMFSNPVIWSDVPDMDLIRVGSDYYMVSNSLTRLNIIWSRAPSTAEGSGPPR